LKMHDSMLVKLEKLKIRLAEIEALLIDSETIKDMENYTLLNKEFADLKPIVEKFEEYNSIIESIKDANEIIESGDEELKSLAEDELKDSLHKPGILEQELKLMLLPKDSADDGSAFLEIRAGAGGDEAGIFAGDLFRMYSRLAEREGWNLDVIDIKQAEQGGLKEVVAQLNGKSVFKVLKFESGVHRVQRVPETESPGRIQTSTCTVAVLPEVEEVQDIAIDKNDLRIDTYRASGAGGQHVNKTDSAVRLTHIPTGLVVECQDGRSQHKNKEKALSLLASKLKQQEIESQQESIASERKILVGTGDRSEKIRTYNFPQGRMTDHRIKLTQHNLDQIMDGDIKTICDALLAENQLAMLSQLESE
jgi:peptide chain release factor 1